MIEQQPQKLGAASSRRCPCFMEWEQHLMTAEGCVRIDDAEKSSDTQGPPPTDAIVPTEAIVPVSLAPAKAVTDVWQALMKGKRPGPDPRARDGYGRVTMQAWLASRLAELSPEEKYALLRAAVSEDPPCTAGLRAVLDLVVDIDINA